MSRIVDDKVQIEVNGIKIYARFDMLAIAEAQYYFGARGKKYTVPQMFEEIQNENYFVICNLLIFCIKSCNPQKKMIDIFNELKFANRGEIVEGLLTCINKSMPKNEGNENEEDLPPSL